MQVLFGQAAQNSEIIQNNDDISQWDWDCPKKQLYNFFSLQTLLMRGGFFLP